MRTLAFILLIITPVFTSAQQLDEFSNGIFKFEETEEAQKTLHISDFKYLEAVSPKSSFLDLPRTKPGIAFAASALIPGSGQAANGKWVRAGIYFTAEVVGIIYHLDRNAKAKRQEEAYEQFSHKNWSVVAYSQWLVQYSDANHLNQEGLEDLRGEVFNGNGDPISPDWQNTRNDWGEVPMSTLRKVESKTPYILNSPSGCGSNDPPTCNRRSNFSHNLPDYGSQQYYELISKYYQFQPGWKDWYSGITTTSPQNPALYQYMWNGQDEPSTLFYEGRDRAEAFNQNYRVAGNILKLLLLNHVVSAFDALFTVQLKNSRIETEANLMKMEQFSVSWHF